MRGWARAMYDLGTPRSPTALPPLTFFPSLKAFDHILAAVEDIVGHHGYHYWRDK